MFIKLQRVELRLCEEEVQYQGSKLSEIISKGVYIKKPEDVFRLFGFLSERVQEEVYALYMDAKNKLLGFYLVSKGSIANSAVSPADVLRPALLLGACSVIVVHNHPSGDPNPSDQDKQFARRMKEACMLLAITLDDCLVIGRGSFRSCL